MIRNYLPYFIYKRFFGDRKKYKTKIKLNDKDWKLWLVHIQKIYSLREESLPGSIINYFAYNIMKSINLEKNTVLEIGPGNLNHLNYWCTKPKKYYLVDTNLRYLKISNLKLKNIGIKAVNMKINSSNFKLNCKKNSVDIVISFFSLEHIYNLSKCIKEIKRVLKKNGRLIFAIPNEGSFAWGFARYLISRRWMIKNTNINYDKIICWEHPNFATRIIKNLDKNLSKSKIKNFPNIFFEDLILIKKGVYKKN